MKESQRENFTSKPKNSRPSRGDLVTSNVGERNMQLTQLCEERGTGKGKTGGKCPFGRRILSRRRLGKSPQREEGRIAKLRSSGKEPHLIGIRGNHEFPKGRGLINNCKKAYGKTKFEKENDL